MTYISLCDVISCFHQKNTLINGKKVHHRLWVSRYLKCYIVSGLYASLVIAYCDLTNKTKVTRYYRRHDRTEKLKSEWVPVKSEEHNIFLSKRKHGTFFMLVQNITTKYRCRNIKWKFKLLQIRRGTSKIFFFISQQKHRSMLWVRLTSASSRGFYIYFHGEKRIKTFI